MGGCCSSKATINGEMNTTPPLQLAEASAKETLQLDNQSQIIDQYKEPEPQPEKIFEETAHKKRRKKKHKKKKRGKKNTNPPAPVEEMIHSIAEPMRINRQNFVNIAKGSILNQYRLQGKLGDGSFGSVYKATHRSSGVQRAIKSIPKRNIRLNKDKILQEVAILRELVTVTQDHPNIIKVFEVIEEKHYLHIVTELCTGGELFDRIVASRSFSENKAAQYMTQLMQAINYCHKRGIVHRDLKPENLILENDRDDAILKVIDFGESMKKMPNENMTQRTGTAYYIAPEVLAGNYTEKCDIWSCGVILYVMLSGYPPFNGPNDRAIFNKIVRGNFNFSGLEWYEVSREVKTLILSMLTVDPSQRPSAEQVLQDEWIKNRSGNNVADNPIIKESLGNLMKFTVMFIQTGHRLQQAALEFIASQLSSQQETEQLRKLFISLDTDGDGQLSKEEIMNGFSLLGFRNAQEVEELFQKLDTDGSGCLDYTEFLTATMNWEVVLSNDKLLAAFKAVDADGSGKITIDELKKFFGFDDEDSGWTHVLFGIDENGDGEIDFEEFKDLMLKVVPSNKK